CATLVNLRPPTTLHDAVREWDRLDESLVRRLAARHPCGLHLLAAPGRRPVAHHSSLRGVLVHLVRQAAARPDVLSPTILTSALVQAEQVGAGVAEVLRRPADDLRGRRRER